MKQSNLLLAQQVCTKMEKFYDESDQNLASFVNLRLQEKAENINYDRLCSSMEPMINIVQKLDGSAKLWSFGSRILLMPKSLSVQPSTEIVAPRSEISWRSEMENFHQSIAAPRATFDLTAYDVDNDRQFRREQASPVESIKSLFTQRDIHWIANFTLMRISSRSSCWKLFSLKSWSRCEHETQFFSQCASLDEKTNYSEHVDISSQAKLGTECNREKLQNVQQARRINWILFSEIWMQQRANWWTFGDGADSILIDLESFP
jgi:hypothetical protein